MKKTVIYELNEISYEFVMRYIAYRPDSAIAKIISSGSCVKTDNTDVGHLSPWITWPTLHRGVNNEAHCITDFGEDLNSVNNIFPTFMELAKRSGHTVGVFSSLQTGDYSGAGSGYDFFIPDPFTESPKCIPVDLTEFQLFNLRMTRENGKNVKSKFSFFEYVKFGYLFLKLGVSLRSVYLIVKQLFSEIFIEERKTRRRSIQSIVAFDLFYKLLRQSKPNLATYFTNNVASSMHRYWPATFPGDYTEFRMPEKWMATYKDEIWAAMNVADKQISTLNDFCMSNNYRLIILSSMGQAAVQESEMLDSQLLFADKEKLFNHLKIVGPWKEHLSMSPRYVFEFESKADCDLLNHFAENCKIRGNHINWIRLSDYRIQIELGQANMRHDELIEYMGNAYMVEQLGLQNVKIQDMAGCYAYHVKEGVFISNDKLINYDESLSVLTIAPLLLKEFGVAIPEYMQRVDSLKFI